MNIRTVEVWNFTCHEHARWDIPRTGIVKVSGPNGAGKSSIIEAVAWGLWGKSLRENWLPFGEDGGSVKITTDTLWVNRIREGNRTKVVWAYLGEEPTQYESTTKANAELHKALGISFEGWRRTAVFSSSDSALFATATDAERKALLEQLLGIDRFDAALDICKADIRAQEAKVREVESALHLKQELYAGELLNKQRLEDLLLTDPVDIEALKLENARIAGELVDLESELQSKSAAATDINVAITNARATIRQLEATLAKLASDKCGVCSQSISPAFRAEMGAALNSALNDNGQEISTLERDYAVLREDCKSLQRAISTLFDTADHNRRIIDAADQQLRQAARVQGQISEVQRRLDHFSIEIEALKQQRSKAYVDLKELQACATALGYRGIRNQLLAKALGGLEAACNAWLSRIADRVWVTIRPYTERKSGVVAECISLQVQGAGGGYGYAGSSGGERRRIDVALILALGEFAAATSGSKPGTIFCDEVFDALYTDGVQRVAESLADISRERGVLVISHNQEVLNILGGQHIRMGHEVLPD